jgi:hypothetical protein
MTLIKKLAAIFGSLLTILLGLLLCTEIYWPFAPYTDTRFSEKFTVEGFNAIQTGTSLDSVRSILGEPIWKQGCGGCWEQSFYVKDQVFEFPKNRTCEDPCKADRQRWQFSDDGACSWWDFAWKYYAIDFYQGNVIAKHAEWHWD